MTTAVALPTGTVTFLFSDLEGSTKLFEAHPRDYPVAVARHTALLRSAVERNDGVVFETVGDAVYAAFAAPSAAAGAAIDGQVALIAEDWRPLGPLRSRMGLHSGEVHAQEGRYIGAPLYRCARLMSAAWGGQIVLSSATATLARDALSPGATLRDLGEHRLKDLQAPEHVYQLVHPSLPDRFPPLRAVSSRPNNLPILHDAFVGRDGEIRQATALLARDDVALVTVTGPGGAGKTRFALHLAAEAVERRRSGAWLVDLSNVTDATLVAHAIAAALGLRESAGRDLRAAVLAYLAPSDALIVLDNFEQLMAGVGLVADLLAGCPDLKLLVTSREPLRIRGEQEFPLGPLSAGAQAGASHAVELFVDRARRVVPSFAPAGDELAAVAEICVRVDGLPLAIELAAARVRSMPPRALVARLEQRLPLLTGGPRDLPARQRTLRDTIRWSYELLGPKEQRFLRRVSVFRGAWTIDGAAAVTDGSDAYDLTDALVAKSLVVPVAAEPEPRYRLLELVREFATGELEACEESAEARQRRARYVADSMAGMAKRMSGEEQVRLLCALDPQLEDIRDVLRGGLDDPATFGDDALSIASEMYVYWFCRFLIREAKAWADAYIALCGSVRGVPGGLHLVQCFARAELGDISFAVRDAERAADRFREDADSSGGVWAGMMGCEYSIGIDDEAAHHFLAIGRRFAAECGEDWAQGGIGVVECDVHRSHDDFLRAIDSAEEALLHLREPSFLRIAGLNNLAHAYLRLGDPARAARLFTDVLEIQPLLGHWITPYCLAGLAALAASRADLEGAALLIGATASALSRLDQALQPVDNAEYVRTADAVRDMLGPGAYQAAFGRGAAMTLDEATAFARDLAGR